MDEHDGLVGEFETNRAHLRSVAYRMLGSMSEADDAVQEAWLRFSRAGTDGVENLSGWLTTVVARVYLDMLRSRRSRREEPLGAHLPDPVVSRVDGIDPEHEALLADSLGPALLVVLEMLAPPRAARVRAPRPSLPCPSMTSLRSWGGPRSRHGSSRAGHGAVCRVRPRFPTRISPATARRPTPSPPPPAPPPARPHGPP